MPQPSRPSAHQPSFVPAFQPNSDGVVVNNSAQSAMIMGMQRLILEQGDGKKRANEEAHMSRRQGIVDRYNKAAGGPDKIRTERWVYKLPTIASPQQIYINLYDNNPVANNRAKQEAEFQDSFLAKDKFTLKMVYDEVDIAVAEVDKRKLSLSFMKKHTWAIKKKADFFYEPLREAVQYLDNHFKEEDKPLRIKWREVQYAPGKTKVDLFFVYPNFRDQYDSGFHRWMGSEDVTQF